MAESPESSRGCGHRAARLPPPPPQPPLGSSVAARPPPLQPPASLVRIRSSQGSHQVGIRSSQDPSVRLPRSSNGSSSPHNPLLNVEEAHGSYQRPADPTCVGRHLPPQHSGHGDDGAGLHQPRSPTYTPIDPVLNVEVFNTVAGSPMCTPPYDEEFSAGSPSERTPVVQVTMPQSINSRTSKRTRHSTVGSRIDRTRTARCAVGSPSLRIINRIQISPRLRSPRTTATQNSNGSRAGSTSRQLRSVYWKEFEPIMINESFIQEVSAM